MTMPIPPWPGTLTDLGSHRVFVRRTPPGDPDCEPAVFVHGLAGSSTNWTDLMDELRDLLDGWALDLPGFGDSPAAPRGDYTVSAHARAVVALIERTVAGPVHLFGNSLGGTVATRIAAHRPDLVRTLTLVSPALPDLRPRLAPYRMTVASVPGLGTLLLRQLLRLPVERRVRATLGGIYHDPSRLSEQRIAEAIEDTRRSDARGYMVSAVGASLRGLVAEYLRLPGPRYLWRQAQSVTAPTLVLYGRYDRLVDPRMAARARRAFARARAVVLPEVGHVAQMEQPDVVAAEFRSFLADLPGGPDHRPGSSSVERVDP